MKWSPHLEMRHIFDISFSFQATEMVLTWKWGRIQPEIQIWADQVVAASWTLVRSPWKWAKMISEMTSQCIPDSSLYYTCHTRSSAPVFYIVGSIFFPVYIPFIIEIQDPLSVQFWRYFLSAVKKWFYFQDMHNTATQNKIFTAESPVKRHATVPRQHQIHIPEIKCAWRGAALRMRQSLFHYLFISTKQWRRSRNCWASNFVSNADQNICGGKNWSHKYYRMAYQQQQQPVQRSDGGPAYYIKLMARIEEKIAVICNIGRSDQHNLHTTQKSIIYIVYCTR